MAERVSKHCWATPKCGIRTAQIHFPNGEATGMGYVEDVKSDFQFVIVRNPYARIVSFYISKVIYTNARTDPKYRSDVIPHLQAGKLNFSFEQMVSVLNPAVERHLRLQSHKMKITEQGVTADEFHIVRCEHWTEDMKLVCTELGLDHDHYGYVWENRSDTTDSITEYVGNKTPNWFRENGVPSDYNLFYNEETKAKVGNVYGPDFQWLTCVYDDFEMVKPSK